MNRVFILGAGFSHHMSGGSLPLMVQLGQEFEEQHPWTSSYLSQGKSSPLNLEILLTQLDLDLQGEGDTGKKSVLAEHVCAVKRFLRKRLDLENIPGPQIEKAKSLCSRLFSDRDSIITFNYDCLLEHVLWKLKFWSPNGGYGQSPNLNDLASYGSQIEKNAKGIIILKPHSSLNFEEVKTDCDAYLQPWISDKLFPGIKATWNKEAKTPPVVLPSFVKIFGENRTLMYIWHEAIEKIRQAKTIMVIGYSLPRADAMTRFLLSFVSAGERKNRNNGKVRIGILNKGLSASGVLKQMIEVGQFGEEDIERLVLKVGSDKDYDKLCCWSRQADEATECR